jgi:hypothetical protein
MLFHNNGWSIYRDHNGYWVIPPPNIDPTQTPRKLTRHSNALRDLKRAQENSA